MRKISLILGPWSKAKLRWYKNFAIAWQIVQIKAIEHEDAIQSLHKIVHVKNAELELATTSIHKISFLSDTTHEEVKAQRYRCEELFKELKEV